MKKLGIIAILAVVGIGSGAAFAASLGVPWFVDNADVATRIPQTKWIGTSKRGVVTGLVTLKNNTNATIVCRIKYFAPDGTDLGPGDTDPAGTFAIAPLSALAFRPGKNDPATVPGGQEGTQAVLVPDSPQTNGSMVISWSGGASDIQGQVAYYQSSAHPNDVGGADPRIVTFSYAHLLPPGTV